MEHSPVRGTSRCAPGAFSLTAPVFRSSRAQKGAWCARDSTWAAGSGAHGESTIFRRARRQSSQQPRQHHTSATPTTSPAPEAARQLRKLDQRRHNNTSHITSHITNHITNHITGAGKPRANQASSPGNITHQPAATAAPTPEATHRPHHQRQKPRAACVNASYIATGRRRTSP